MISLPIPHLLRNIITCAILLLSITVSRAQIAPAPRRMMPEELTPLVGGPTLVTLQGKDIPLRVAVEQLMQAAQLSSENVLSEQDAKHTVSVAWRGVPFWSAAQDLERQTGLRWSATFFDSANPLRLASSLNSTSEGLGGQYGTRTPLVTLVANQVMSHTQRVLRFGAPNPEMTQDDNSESVMMRLAAYFDPHLHILPTSVMLQVPALTQVGGVRNYSYPTGGTLGWDVPVSLNDFQLPILPLAHQIEPRKVPLIQGALYGTVIKKSERWEIPDVTAPQIATHAVNGATYRVEEVSLDKSTLTFQITSHAFRGVSPRLDQSSPLVHLFDGDGKEMKSQGGFIKGSSSREGVSEAAGFSYFLGVVSKEFPEGKVHPGPFKLVWDMPTEVQSFQVPFKFHDVPLP